MTALAGIHSPTHLRKLLSLYQIDLALVKDGYRPASVAVDIWTRDLDNAATVAFIEERIGIIVVKLMTQLEKENA